MTAAAGGEDEHRHWRRNLAVALGGSFSTIVAMTLLLPFLPVYVQELGVTDPADIAVWSGLAYGSTFLTAAIVAPVWGRLADRYGNKLMLIRASLGMVVAMSLIGMAHNVYELVALRAFAGIAGGYSSGSMILVASETPKARSAWALGLLSSGIMAGNLVGPLIGGLLPPIIGIRATFWLASAVIFVAFSRLSSSSSRSESLRPRVPRAGRFADIENKLPVIAMMVMGALLMFATMSIEPIITLYVQEIEPDPAKVIFIAGLAMSAAALGSIVSAPRLGRLADRIGHWRVLIGALVASAILLIPQALITAPWQLIALRFLMGLALGGLMPTVTSIIRHNVPGAIVGRVLGLATSSQYVGQVSGPLIGGLIGGHVGMRAVFIGTAGLMVVGAIFAWLAEPKQRSEVAG